MNRDVQRIIDSNEYQQVFPNTTLWSKNVRTTAHGSYLRNSDLFEIVNYEGAYRSAGVGAGITGLGGHYLLIDDFLKNMQEALSKTTRKTILDWYRSTFYTRAEKDAGILITATRWHEADLIGSLLEFMAEDEDADQWVLVNFPAVKEDDSNPDDPRKIGDPLWEWKYNLERLAKIKASLGTQVWNALYQQRPSPESGNIIERTWFRKYREMPPIEQFDVIMTSWDCNFKAGDNNSFVCGTVWGTIGPRRYLLDMYHERTGFIGTLSAMKDMAGKWPMSIEHAVEDKANGPAVIETMCEHVPGVTGFNPGQDSKVARLRAVSPQFEAGNIWVPDPTTIDAPWVKDYIDELVSFPNAATNDRTDSSSQALLKLHSASWLDALAGSDGQGYSVGEEVRRLFGYKF